jgi:hypothetical protein
LHWEHPPIHRQPHKPAAARPELQLPEGLHSPPARTIDPAARTVSAASSVQAAVSYCFRVRVFGLVCFTHYLHKRREQVVVFGSESACIHYAIAASSTCQARVLAPQKFVRVNANDFSLSIFSIDWLSSNRKICLTLSWPAAFIRSTGRSPLRQSFTMSSNNSVMSRGEPCLLYTPIRYFSRLRGGRNLQPASSSLFHWWPAFSFCFLSTSWK